MGKRWVRATGDDGEGEAAVLTEPFRDLVARQVKAAVAPLRRELDALWRRQRADAQDLAARLDRLERRPG